MGENRNKMYQWFENVRSFSGVWDRRADSQTRPRLAVFVRIGGPAFGSKVERRAGLPSPQRPTASPAPLAAAVALTALAPHRASPRRWEHSSSLFVSSNCARSHSRHVPVIHVRVVIDKRSPNSSCHRRLAGCSYLPPLL